MTEHNGRILAFVGDDYEDLELWYPKFRLEEAGYQVTLAGLEPDMLYLGKHGYPCESEIAVADARGEDYVGVLIPGGWMPDKLRRDSDVLELTRHFMSSGKLVASICHGPWIMISAGVCQGIRMTSTPGIKDDLINAGAEWVDEELVVHQNVVTSRRPPDLPAFGAALVAFLRDWRP